MARKIEQAFGLRRFAVILAAALGGCGFGEHASVIIKYDTKLPADNWALPSSGQNGVKDAFMQFAKRNDYKCRANFKHTDELLCRGPKDVHLSFQPALNKAEFIAAFSWLNTADRNHEEFVNLVSGFTREMSAVVGEGNVLVKDNP